MPVPVASREQDSETVGAKQAGCSESSGLSQLLAVSQPGVNRRLARS